MGSAAVSGRQAPFDGSDRQARGRLLAALAEGPVTVGHVASIMDRDTSTAMRLAMALVEEGLAEMCADVLRLPGDRNRT